MSGSEENAANLLVIEEIRVQLVRKRLSQTELARRMGVSSAWIWRRLSGETGLTLVDIARIAKALDVPVGVLTAPLDRI